MFQLARFLKLTFFFFLPSLWKVAHFLRRLQPALGEILVQLVSKGRGISLYSAVFPTSETACDDYSALNATLVWTVRLLPLKTSSIKSTKTVQINSYSSSLQ